jgi:hypothetical protein
MSDLDRLLNTLGSDSYRSTVSSLSPEEKSHVQQQITSSSTAQAADYLDGLTSGSDSGDVNSDLDSSDSRSEPKKIAIDCETTGLGTNRRALQWGYATDTSAGSVYYKPGVNSTAGALKIHQLTPRFLHDRLWRCLQRRRCFRDVSFSSPTRCTLKMTVWNRLDTRVEQHVCILSAGDIGRQLRFGRPAGLTFLSTIRKTPCFNDLALTTHGSIQSLELGVTP